MKKSEIQQNWDFYMCRVEGKAASIRLNLALYNIAPIEDYKYRISIFIKMNNPDEYGLSSNEEYPILCDIEDAVAEKIENLDGISAGVVKSNGNLEIYIFTKNPNEIEIACKEALSLFQDYKWNLYIDEDPTWDTYFNFLYPDSYSYQVMLNRRVVENLMQNGDNLEAEREVDHWLYFNKEEDLNLYIKKIENLNYKILSVKDLRENEENKRDEYPYQLNISRKDKANLKYINEIVWELIEAIETLDGYYDGWGCPIVK